MSASGGGGGGVGGALSLMGCVREASPPPQDFVNQGDFSTQPNPQDNQPKETKKRRFHPLRGLRKIFRRKSRGAADLNAITGNVEGNDHHIVSHNREDVTMRHPAGRPEESRSRSASDLLTDSCDKDSVFRRRSGIGEALAKLRGGPGQLSISHDSVFPGEVPYTRPLSTLDPLATLERIPSNVKESGSKETSSLMNQRHRVSLQVLEQMKTVIESRNQVSTIETSTIVHNFGSSSNKTVYRIEETQAKTTTTTKSTVDDVDKIRSSAPKEDLPELESSLDPLTHEAAKHRITVRPKNRRPPNRVASQFGAPTNMRKISESSEALESLDTSGYSVTDYPVESKNVTVIRKSSSSRMIRSGGEIVGELEAKLQRSNSPLSKSPDSLESSVLSRNSNSIETRGDHEEEEEGEEEEEEELVKSDDIKAAVGRKLSNRISKGSDIFAELSSKLPRRRSSVNRMSKSPDSLENTWSKSTDSFERLEESVGPKPAIRKSLNFVSKSTERVSKSSDSLEALESLNAMNSDDSIERRRSSYEFRGVQRTGRAISKSSESFGPVNEMRKNETNSGVDFIQEDKIRMKRSSTSDVTSLTRNVIFDNITMSKSSENVDPEIDITGQQKSEPKRHWRPTKRITVSSESSDNLELDDELENRRARKPAKRIPSTSFVDIQPLVDTNEAERKPPLGRKLSRFKKSSESSELGSTDTVDSDKKNKSSASVETIDSLERDLDNRTAEEDVVPADDVVEKRVKNETWSGQVSDATSIEIEETKPLISEKSYWRESTEAKENMDIHQLLALTIVTHIADNGNQRNSVLFPKKKLSSAPTSPEKQEDNKIIFNNLLSSKNEEDLQNMLNGNISEVSTDTKSFKEKLIMFEKLGK